MIAEVAEITGLSRKAVARRVDRGSLQSVLRDGRRRIPRAELVRAGLVARDTDAPPRRVDLVAPPEDLDGPSLSPAYPPEAVAALVRELLDRFERQASEIAQFRALTTQAESLRVSNEVAELRARIAELEAERRAGQPLGPAGDPLQPGRQLAAHGFARPHPAGSEAAKLWLPPQAGEPRGTPSQPRQGRDGGSDVAELRARIAQLETEKRSTRLGRGMRFAVEALFIGAVAAVAWRLELEPLAVAGVMALAWTIVALTEWISWAQRR